MPSPRAQSAPATFSWAERPLQFVSVSILSHDTSSWSVIKASTRRTGCQVAMRTWRTSGYMSRASRTEENVATSGLCRGYLEDAEEKFEGFGVVADSDVVE
ncbi:uncharacterized protein BDV17DRAFT_159717 [Aspergillus undulatus]|uniref:uncharacterized protein n=1 Tax=Aspergillus undulatus TaxID=1810928 RepID=UPI003CCCF5E8